MSSCVGVALFAEARRWPDAGRPRGVRAGRVSQFACRVEPVRRAAKTPPSTLVHCQWYEALAVIGHVKEVETGAVRLSEAGAEQPE